MSYLHIDNSPRNGSKKRDGEKRTSPLGIPYREKGQREEISRYAFSTDYRAGAGARHARARGSVRRAVAAAVEMALVAFRGTRGPGMTDESLWASIAWRIGADRFEEAVRDKLAEDGVDSRPKNPRATFQAFLDSRYPKPEGGAK